MQIHSFGNFRKRSEFVQQSAATQSITFDANLGEAEPLLGVDEKADYPHAVQHHRPHLQSGMQEEKVEPSLHVV